MKPSGILGLNSRNHLYTSVYNTRRGKIIANSKLTTKEALSKVGIRVPEVYAVIDNPSQLDAFDFLSLPEDFVVKPNKGLGGEGIEVIEERGKYAGEWITSEGEIVGINDLRLHVQDILMGQYSMDDLPDTAYIEERVKVHPKFAKYSYHGTPDIRVIVFNKIPVMAMLRLPTEESSGRANLFQGAVAAGIDITTGMTTHAIHHGKQIVFYPGTRRKLRFIEIPQWDEVLETAIRCQETTGLGYLGVDVVLQPTGEEDGKVMAVPMVLEINAQPGLKIQLANQAGLRDRLQRVEGLNIKDARHGIRVAKALFADPMIMEKELGRKTIGLTEEVEVVSIFGDRVKVAAKVDTGADRSSIDIGLAEELGLLHDDNVLYETYYRSALGRRKRKVVGLTYYMAGKKIKTTASVTNRKRMRYDMLIGRNDLDGYVIMP